MNIEKIDLPYESWITGVSLFELPEDIDLLTEPKIKDKHQQNNNVSIAEVDDDYCLGIFCFCKKLR